MIRRPVLLALLLLGGCNGPAPVAPKPPSASASKPMRVMSLNLCTDQLLLALLPPSRIASVTWLARDPSGSLMATQAMQVSVNHGHAEDVLAQKPDLVIAGTFTTPALRAMLKRLGYPLIEVEDAGNVDGVRTITRQVAAVLGETARGEALIAHMDRQLADLARDPGPPIRVAAWDQSGFSAGQGTLYDTVLTAAGATNVAHESAALGYRKPDVEVLLKTAPAVLIRGSRDAHIAGLGDGVTRHRLVRRYWDGPRTVTIPQAYYACGTPMVADAAIALRGELRRALPLARPLPFQSIGSQ